MMLLRCRFAFAAALRHAIACHAADFAISLLPICFHAMPPFALLSQTEHAAGC